MHTMGLVVENDSLSHPLDSGQPSIWPLCFIKVLINDIV